MTVSITHWDTDVFINNSNYVDFMRITSESSNYAVGILIFLAIVIVMVILLVNRGVSFPAAICSALFAHVLLVILSYPMGILPDGYLIGSIVLFIISLATLWLSSR